MNLRSRLVSFALAGAGLMSLGAFFRLSAAETPEIGITLRGEKMVSQGYYRFNIEAPPGRTYPIAVSVDMVHWTVLTRIVGRGPLLLLEDPEAGKFEKRFYQVGLPPTPVPNMVPIRPGTFTMGSPATETGRDSREGPTTVVTLSRGFWIGKYEVTQAEYISVMGSNIAFISYNTNLPVDFVTWFDATNYCHTLTAKERNAGHLPEGFRYRLPTEVEWEYACRAGTTTPFGIGNGTTLASRQANFDGTFPYGGAPSGRYANLTTLGGSYAPNAWGLYDMHGNVWEWCEDWFGAYPGGNVTNPKGAASGTARVLRGGGYTSVGQGCRSAKRDSRPPGYGNTIQGLRIVLATD
jgi:formylglycine-generating enzyme required for sulfatase activity